MDTPGAQGELDPSLGSFVLEAARRTQSPPPVRASDYTFGETAPTIPSALPKAHRFRAKSTSISFDPRPLMRGIGYVLGILIVVVAVGARFYRAWHRLERSQTEAWQDEPRPIKPTLGLSPLRDAPTYEPRLRPRHAWELNPPSRPLPVHPSQLPQKVPDPFDPPAPFDPPDPFDPLDHF